MNGDCLCHYRIHQKALKDLVKKIAVKGITESGSTATESYVYLESINLSKAAPTATIQFDYKGATNIRKITRTVSQGYNLYDNSNQMEEYKDGFIVSRIDGRDQLRRGGRESTVNIDEIINIVAYDFEIDGCFFKKSNIKGDYSYVAEVPWMDSGIMVYLESAPCMEKMDFIIETFRHIMNHKMAFQRQVFDHVTYAISHQVVSGDTVEIVKEAMRPIDEMVRCNIELMGFSIEDRDAIVFDCKCIYQNEIQYIAVTTDIHGKIQHVKIEMD